MPKYKLIAADLDDTLLNDDLKISERNRRAFQLAQDMGVIVTIATGRMFRSALPVALELGIEGPLVTYQGAFVKSVSTGEVMVHRPVPVDLARKVITAGYENGLHINIYINDTLYMDRITEEGKYYVEQAKVEMNPVGNLLDFLQNDPTKVLFIGEADFLDKLSHQMKEQFGESLYITKSKPNYLEFMHPKATKMHGISRLAEVLGILPEEIITFGDSYNDIEMIDYAGLGVAVGNAPQAIRERADLVADTNNNDGVAKVIEEFVLSTRD